MNTVNSHSIKGEKYQELLDTINTNLQNGNNELAELDIETFIEKIQEDSPEAQEITRRFNTIESWYHPIQKQMNDTLQNGGYLERRDAVEAKPQLKNLYLWKRYYVLKRVFHMYKLYENDSVIDYEL